jgi:type II secretory pathway pseudopilin PulG|tara:strand:+ start:5445 stop:6062 length:618 start_codon:yes stop_codon:yes gene_type:complete
MNRRGLSLIEMIIAIGITAVIGAAIASMMAAATNSLTSKDDGRQSAIRLATTQVRLGAYIAPSRCIVDKSNTHVTLWLEDSNESKTIHATELRWIEFDNDNAFIVVKFVDFPEEWSQAMIDDYNIECISNTDYETLLSSFEAIDLVETIPLVDAINACKFWINATDPFGATRISVRFSLESTFGTTSDGVIDETILLHQPPAEQQ